MPISAYLKHLRAHIGSDVVLLPAVNALIRDEHGHILMERRSDNNMWALPGGAIDPGEHPAQALVREVWEETGLKVVPEYIVGVFGGLQGFYHRYPNGDEVESVTILFACRVVAGHLGAKDGESAELRYVSLEHMASLELFDAFPLDLFAPATAPAGVFAWQPQWLEQLQNPNNEA